MGLSGCLLLGCTRVSEPAAVVSVEEPRSAAAAKSPAFATNAELRALAERLEAAVAGPITGPMALGQASGEAGSTVLRYGADELFEITDAGTDCPRDLGLPLISFEGPEAFLLTGALPPQIVTLTSATEQPRCWSLVGRPRVPHDAEPALELSLPIDWEAESEPPLREGVELLPYRDGLEIVELSLSPAGPRLRVMAADGALLHDWHPGDEDCDFESIDLALHLFETGALLELVRDCDYCDGCEHSGTTSKWTSEQWLSQAGSMIEVRSAHRTNDWYDFWEDDGSGTVEAIELVTRELWSLGASVVVHEITIHSEERSFYPDDAGNGGEADEEFTTHDTLELQWRVEPPSGEPIMRVRGSGDEAE